MTDWFKGLWHGRSLAFTVAVITVVVCLGYLFLTVEPPHEASSVDAGESDQERPFTPRLPDSSWSAVNTHRSEQLIASGRMRPAGARAFRERDQSATRRRAHERESAQLEPALAATLRAHGKAAAFFAAQPPGYRRIATFWVMSAKKPETRARRLAQLIARSEQGGRLDLLKPNG